jgi:RimJ/RimL family protein N-acetyltransferase
VTDVSSAPDDPADPAITIAAAPPEEIALPGLILRRWHPAWAEPLQAAVDASLPELRPFMPWATDDHGIEQGREYIGRSVAEWDRHENFNYAVFAVNDGVVDVVDGQEAEDLIGSCGLMTRMGEGVLEIGYWIHSAHTGRGHATAIAQALADAALALPGIERAAIKHDPANAASGRVAEKAGFSHVGEVAHEPTAPGETGTHWVWERRG